VYRSEQRERPQLKEVLEITQNEGDSEGNRQRSRGVERKGEREEGKGNTLIPRVFNSS
jgi:hypothetical protein